MGKYYINIFEIIVWMKLNRDVFILASFGWNKLRFSFADRGISRPVSVGNLDRS